MNEIPGYGKVTIGPNRSKILGVSVDGRLWYDQFGRKHFQKTLYDDKGAIITCSYQIDGVEQWGLRRSHLNVAANDSVNDIDMS